MPRSLATKTYQLISDAHNVLEEIQPATVRGVCYKLFVGSVIPDMSKNSTNRVSTALVTAREQGLIPWEWIVDENRSIERKSSWGDPLAFVETVRYSYTKDRWADQPKRVVVVSEKGTIRGVVKPIIDRYGVDFVSMSGYASATVLHDMARQSARDSRETQFLYIGDFDPSGRHMSDVDILDRLSRYDGKGFVTRLALDEQDRDELPGFAAKRSDSRYRWYVERYGTRCAELDALDPRDLRDRVERGIREHIEADTWERSAAVEQVELESIQGFVTEWQNLFSGQPENAEGVA